MSKIKYDRAHSRVMLVYCACGRHIEAPPAETRTGADEEYLVQSGWDVYGYRTTCPACVDGWPCCERCRQPTHPSELAQLEPVTMCWQCAQDLDTQADDALLIARHGSVAVLGLEV